MTSKEVINLLEKNGWVLDRVKGSHHVFHKEGRSDHLTVPHPRKDMPKGLLHKILKNM